MLQFQKGEKAAFEKLMERNYKRVLNFIYRFVGRQEIAEDLTQEVFIKVYRAVSSYQPRAKFCTWLYQIAKNISLNELRSHKKQTISLEETFEVKGGEITRQVADENAKNPYQEVSEKETADAVKEAVDALP